MKTEKLLSGLSRILLSIVIFCTGCDMFKGESIPENLPPVPEQCSTLENQYTHVLLSAYSSVDASQIQVTAMANKFTQCMEDAGLSRGEAKGIIQNIESKVREQVDKDSGQGIVVR